MQRAYDLAETERIPHMTYSWSPERILYNWLQTDPPADPLENTSPTQGQVKQILTIYIMVR